MARRRTVDGTTMSVEAAAAHVGTSKKALRQLIARKRAPYRKPAGRFVASCREHEGA